MRLVRYLLGFNANAIRSVQSEIPVKEAAQDLDHAKMGVSLIPAGCGSPTRPLGCHPLGRLRG